MDDPIAASFVPDALCPAFEFELQKQALSSLVTEANQKIINKRTQLARKVTLLKQKSYKRSKKKADNEANKTLQSKLKEIDKTKEELIAEARVECLDLAISIAEEILGTELNTNTDAYKARLEKCLDTLSINKDSVVSVNPMNTEAATKAIKNNQKFTINYDKSIEPGDIEVDLGTGKVNFSWEEHLELLSNNLHKDLHAKNSKSQ